MDKKSGVLDNYHLGEALRPTAEKFGVRCGLSAVQLLAERLAQSIGGPEEDRFSYIWRAAIEEHEQDANRDDYRFVLVDVLRDVAMGATNAYSEGASRCAQTLLESQYATLVRIGIYVCAARYGNIGPIFWESVKTEWFIQEDYWHELYWLIKKNFRRFSSIERARFLAMVDEVRDNQTDEAVAKEWEMGRRRDLLHAAAGLGDTEVDEKYKQLVSRCGPVAEHPDFHYYHSRGGWLAERSPVTSDVLVEMSNAELLALFSSFVPEQSRWDGPTYTGLASALSAAVRASKDGFASSIRLFVEVGRPYQHGLLRGLKERWADDRREISWPDTLWLMHSMVKSPAWKADLDVNPIEGWAPSVYWVIGDMSDLMKAGSSPERQLENTLLAEGLDILTRLLATLEPDSKSNASDAVSHAINSPRGRVIDAVINVALAMRRQEVAIGIDTGATWKLVKPILDAELTSSEAGSNADFAALGGMYCVNLHYLNSKWVEDNFDRLFSTSNNSAWDCAAQGFAYQRYLYDWLYQKLRSGGHLRKLVFSKELPGSVSEKALQFTGLAYLKGLETLEGDSLLAELVGALKVDELSELCWFFWTLRDTNEIAAPVLQFWRQVAEAIRKSNIEQPVLQSALNQLAVFFDELTPSDAQMWAEAAPYAHVRHHGNILVKNMSRLAGKNPNEVAIVFRRALTGFIPDYDKEQVIRCVTQMADNGAIDEAEWICNEYARQNSILLKETYQALRASTRAQLTRSADPT